MHLESNTGHLGGSLSCLDALMALHHLVLGPDDRFVLSKGHAAPVLYSAWAEAGAFDRSKLLTLREISSDLEGHPTPRLPFVDVATGSLGQGICVAVGLALVVRINEAFGTVEEDEIIERDSAA